MTTPDTPAIQVSDEGWQYHVPTEDGPEHWRCEYDSEGWPCDAMQAYRAGQAVILREWAAHTAETVGVSRTDFGDDLLRRADQIEGGNR